MVDYEKIQKQVGNMKTGEKKLIGAQYTAEEFLEVYNFLLELQDEGIILVKAHRESATGLRQIESAYVIKL